MKRGVILSIVSAFILSSCASILNGKYQKVQIPTDYDEEVYINDEEAYPEKGNDIYALERDIKPKQITIKTEGFLDQHYVVAQYKKSPLYILSVVPFGVLLYPLMYDGGPKAYNYEKSYSFSDEKVPLIEDRAIESKELKVADVIIDIEDGENFSYEFYPHYKIYLKGSRNWVKEGTIQNDDDEPIFTKTTLSETINEMLKERGFIDTSNRILTESYTDNLYLTAYIKKIHLTSVGGLYTIMANNNPNKTGFVFMDMVIDWKVMDIFGDSLYSEEFEFKSDQFVYNSGKDGYSDAMENAIKNVIEKSFLTFMNSNELEQILVDDLQAREEDDREVLMMSKSKSYVSNLTEATNSTVTVKTKDSFGSGFFITSDGYLLTNYHVVIDTTDLKVVLNDGFELKAEVIRVSKVHDLAILKVAKEDVLPFKTSNNNQIEIGADVFAIGTPTAEDLSQTVSKGIVSGIRTVDGGGKLIQTDASINSGNSGGPLVTKDGEVLAIVVSKVRGLGIEGVAFGIPVYDILERLHISFE